MQDWLDRRMSDPVRIALAVELTADPEKLEMAKRLKAIDGHLKMLNAATLDEDVPGRLLEVIRSSDRPDADGSGD